MEPQQTPHSQRDGEKEKQSWGHHNSGLEVILQSCRDQNSMVLARKQIHRSIQQNRKPRNEPKTICSINFCQSKKEYPMGKRQSL